MHPNKLYVRYMNRSVANFTREFNHHRIPLDKTVVRNRLVCNVKNKITYKTNYKII